MLSWTFPSLRPPMRRDSRNVDYIESGSVFRLLRLLRSLTKDVDLAQTTADAMLPSMVHSSTLFLPYLSDTPEH